MMNSEQYAQRWHERWQEIDPAHDRSSCWCCCMHCCPNCGSDNPNPHFAAAQAAMRGERDQTP